MMEMVAKPNRCETISTHNTCRRLVANPPKKSPVPYETADYKTQFEGCTVGAPAFPLASPNNSIASAGTYRGPPERNAPAIFLRNASFLI